MQESLFLLATGLALSLVTHAAQAALIDRSNGMIYDDDLDITWLADANYFKTQYDADNSILNTLTGQTVADSYGPHSTTTADFNTSDGRMTWWGAQAWAANLSYGGYDDWRLPTVTTSCLALNCTSGSELGHLFYSELGGSAASSIVTNHDADYALFSNIQNYSYWSGSEYAPNLDYAWFFGTDYGRQVANGKGNQFYGWAVRSGDVAAPASNNTVPEPGTLALLGLSAFGLRRAHRRG